MNSLHVEQSGAAHHVSRLTPQVRHSLAAPTRHAEVGRRRKSDTGGSFVTPRASAHLDSTTKRGDWSGVRPSSGAASPACTTALDTSTALPVPWRSAPED